MQSNAILQFIFNHRIEISKYGNPQHFTTSNTKARRLIYANIHCGGYAKIQTKIHMIVPKTWQVLAASKQF